MLVDGDAAAIVGFKSGRGEVEVVDISLAAHCIEQRVAGDLLLAFEICDDGARCRLFNAFNLFAEAQGYTGVAQVVAESFNNFAVGEFEQAVALFNESDAHAEDGEHAGVFDADNAAAYNDERVGQRIQAENLVAVDDGAAVHRHLGRAGRLGSHSDDDVIGFESGFSLRACDMDMRGVDEVGDAMDNVNAVARKLRLGYVDFSFYDCLDAEGQVGHGDLFLDPVIDAVDGAVVVAGEVEHGLAHGLGGHGAGVDADATDYGARLDDDHALVHLGCSHGGALTGGPGANDDQVILDAHAGVSPRARYKSRCDSHHREATVVDIRRLP